MLRSLQASESPSVVKYTDCTNHVEQRSSMQKKKTLTAKSVSFNLKLKRRMRRYSPKKCFKRFWMKGPYLAKKNLRPISPNHCDLMPQFRKSFSKFRYADPPEKEQYWPCKKAVIWSMSNLHFDDCFHAFLILELHGAGLLLFYILRVSELYAHGDCLAVIYVNLV